MDLLPIRRALLSVTDKSDLGQLCNTLKRGEVELVSTGGTRKKILEEGYEVRSVSDLTGFPEILGGRVKTLHPFIHAGILANKDDPSHMETLKEKAIQAFDLICVNLYNFAGALEKHSQLKDLDEEIDIGGPTLLRAGAKNFHSILVLPETKFYPRLKEELEKNNFQVSLNFRQEMAAYTFKMISEYDQMIAKALS